MSDKRKARRKRTKTPRDERNRAVVSVRFSKLKGLSDVEVEIGDRLTAIMGVNGCGKTTVLHALAGIYRPKGASAKQEIYRLREFFITNKDANWTGSEFSVQEKIADNAWKWLREKGNVPGKVALPVLKCTKTKDRWSPGESKLPGRAVYYFGLIEATPTAESFLGKCSVRYTTEEREDEISRKLCGYIRQIFGRRYAELTKNSTGKKNLDGVRTDSDLRYTELSMGAGERRVIKLLDALLAAEDGALFLIDELELQLHVAAQKQLVQILNEVAQKKHLQIVFTSHSLEMEGFQDNDWMKIQYLSRAPDGKISVYDKINADVVAGLTDVPQRDLRIFVEDSFAENLVRVLLREKKMLKRTEIKCFGSVGNGYTLACGLALADETAKARNLVVLDGDVGISGEEMEETLKKKISGQDPEIISRRERAKELIRWFNLPEDKEKPQEKKRLETFFFDLLRKSTREDNDVVRYAKEHFNEIDHHNLLKDLVKDSGDEDGCVVSEIVSVISAEFPNEWNEFIRPVAQWIDANKK